MPISVRLDKNTKAMLEEAAKALGTSKAATIKESLTEYCPKVLAKKRNIPMISFRILQDEQGAEEAIYLSRASKYYEMLSGGNGDPLRHGSDRRAS